MDTPLPTGIDRSISAMLPEPIYIQAVKDLADDTKTSESSPFGKILKILLDAIQPSLADERELFEKLEAKLNRVILTNGTVQDNRLPEVVTIEKTVERYLNESFKDVTINIKIPPPELKTVLSSAQIFANDGVEGIIDRKGDGLRRAIVFAILRSYVDLNNREDLSATDASTRGNYLLLFEEPELYLYPKAQLILFEALSVFSRNNAVVVSTHSPMFLGPDATATFVKLTKTKDSSIGTKPFTEVYPVDLSELSSKDQFQIICYENNNAAFFANTVLLVEGDSDYLVLPHLAATINSRWTTSSNSVRFAKINGKSSIRRYKTFFERFNSKVKIIADLDLLVTGFNQIEPSQELLQLQSSLLQRIDEFINMSQEDEKEISSSQVRDLQEKGELKALWRKVRMLQNASQQGTVDLEKLNEAVDEFFAYERKNERLEVLKNADEEICALKNDLLSKLRNKDIYVLEKGAIEDYYPDGIEGADKPSRAQYFCNFIKTREAAIGLCNDIVISESGETKKEFELIFESVFDN